ncbi:MAG: tail fiber protein [Bacteroidota bacterium]
MEYYIGQIIMGGWNFAPRGTAFCNGQLLSIAENSALFSLLGTTYGGDGRTTFGLPDLRGRVPVHFGLGPGLTDRRMGEKSGREYNDLGTAQLPAPADGSAITSVDKPVRDFTSSDDVFGYSDNMQPYQVINYVIVLHGIFPSRS